MKKKGLTFYDAGIAFVLAFIFAQFTSVIGVVGTEFVLDILGKSATQIERFWNSAFGYLLQTIYLNIAFVLVFVYYYKKQPKDILTKPTKDTKKYIITCVIIGIATLFLLSGVLNYFQLLVDKLGFSSGTLPYSLDSRQNYLISLVSLALIPAVCEELLFRGVITRALKSKGKIFAIVLSSIMFSIFHFSPAQLVYPICFGLILGIVYLRTNNIIFPILLHFINNALSLSIQYFSNPSSTEVFSHSTFNLMYAIITFIIWISLMRYLFTDFKNYLAKKVGNDENSQENETNPTSKEQKTEPILTNVENEKLNNLIFYGCIAVMVLLYIGLLFV